MLGVRLTRLLSKFRLNDYGAPNNPLHLTAGVGPAEAFGLRLAHRR
jgi:hypothetical protein